MILPILGQQWENIAQYSWGSATLAWMYRQLCDACRRIANDSNLGGCAYLLQIWIWERFPVGRPYRGELEVLISVAISLFVGGTLNDFWITIIFLLLQPWPHHDEESRPTVAYCWKNVGAVRGDPARRYMRYMDDLDCLTQNQVLICIRVFKINAYVLTRSNACVLHRYSGHRTVETSWRIWDLVTFAEEMQNCGGLVCL